MKKFLKAFKALDPRRKRLFIIVVVLILVIIIVGIALTVINKFKTPSAEKFIDTFFHEQSNASKYSIESEITTSNSSLNISLDATRDADTCYMDVNDNNKNISMYVDVLDKNYGIYKNAGAGWVGSLQKKFASVDDPRTAFVESSARISASALSSADFKNLSVQKEDDGSYDVYGYSTYDKVISLLSLSIYAITTSDNYKDIESFFNLYNSNINVLTQFHFSHDKKLVGIKITSDEKLATDANSEYSKFNLKSLMYKITYTGFDANDVYVPVSIDVEAFPEKKE